MPLINCNVELKIKWTKYCVLSPGGNENGSDNNNANNIVFGIKDTELYVPTVTLSARDNQKLSKLLSKELKHQFMGMNIKQKVGIKIGQVNLDILLNQILLETIDYLSDCN